MKLEIKPYKLESGLWAFDHSHNATVGELLCNGTEKVLDDYFLARNKREAKAGDVLPLVIDSKPFNGFDIAVKKIREDEFGTIYRESSLSKEIWLCPWLQGFFGKKPLHLFAKFV